jgi:hypothetical protein
VWSRALVFCLLAFLIQGCASSAAKPDSSEAALVVVEGIVISNELPFPVTDVMINIPATGGFAGCGNIMQASACRTSFVAVDYRADAMVVSWKEYGKPHATDSFVVEAPEGMDPEKPVWLRVVIFAMGQAAAEFVQF